MPTVSSLLSGSVSIGILAGVVSGLCCLVVAGIRWAGELNLQSGDWFYRNIQSRFSRASNLPENNTAHDNGTVMEPESAQVREFIERLVEALVSGQLDDVKLNRMYTHPEYDRLFACHHSALCENLVQLSFALQMAIMNKPLPAEETPSAIHAALKQRVQRIIEEAMTLPNLKGQVPVQNGNAIHSWVDDITSMTYEDILATAILNKVIEQFQQRTGSLVRDTVVGNHNISASSSMEHAPTYISQVEIGVNNHDDCDTLSQEGPRSWSESSHTEPLSMTVEECIEEEVMMYDSANEEDADRSDGVATTSSEFDFYLSGLSFIKHHRVPFPELGVDIVDGMKTEHYSEDDELSDSSQPTDLISSVDSWEENWLFQRRRLKAGGAAESARLSPMPVPMLVPNPSEEFRARIGDRDAEEVSDLSDCSDGALEDVVLAGLEKNLTDDYVPEVSVTSESHDAISQKPSETEIIATMGTKGIIEAGMTASASMSLAQTPSVECLSELGQQDSEYTEHYASVTQCHIGSLPEQTGTVTVPVPKPRTLPVSSQAVTPPQQEMLAVAAQDTELSAPPRPGTIAEREHRKWESAPPLPNNPYSPENINKRLSRQSAGFSSRSSSITSIDFPEMKVAKAPSPVQVVCTSGEPDYKRYGRDYYINHSKAASGERRSSSTSTSPIVQQVCDTRSLLDLEQQVLHRNIYRNSFRACNSASLNFTVNPLFEQGQSKTVQTEDSNDVNEVERVSVIDEVSVMDGMRINPLFGSETLETENEDHSAEDPVLRDEDQTVGPTKPGLESGYSSLSDSLAVHQAHFLRLLPPSKPQMIERSFESLASLRRSVSLKDKRRKRGERLEMGGSLKSRHRHKTQHSEQLALW